MKKIPKSMYEIWAIAYDHNNKITGVDMQLGSFHHLSDAQKYFEDNINIWKEGESPLLKYRNNTNISTWTIVIKQVREITPNYYECQDTFNEIILNVKNIVNWTERSV